MKINELNYEMYALDYVEGNLKGEALQAMELFLSKHPQLKEEMLEICGVALPNNHMIYEDKAALYKKEKTWVSFSVWLSVATAACLVLLIGFIWLPNQFSYTGVVAVNQNYTLDNALSVVPTPQEQNNLNNSIEEVDNKIVSRHQNHTEEVKSAFYDKPSKQMVPDKNSGAVVVINEQKKPTASFEGNMMENEIGTRAVSAEYIKEQKQVLIPIEDESIVVTTIELGALQNTIDADNKVMIARKAKRKKVFIENVKYVFQNTLLPEGVTVAINN